MRTVKIVYWQEEDGKWLGCPESSPEYMTQGESLDELRDNLRDILGDLEDKNIPFVRIHEDMSV